ncbi:hypothetical protein J31TS4_02780 [Paenibacillus sp. J31TS4]|uniref:type I pullulanase n=1 Tax=Paenibacillus sp. J31TS4 TaxID=2807195 RepID=UPI001B28F5BE|nr:type I pullulanase [Paenibacillus sp. J31TS4]GIP36998.1 hypothetical protein J31TS4_02780 [Paenibacillus sp. J31TS4]
MAVQREPDGPIVYGDPEVIGGLAIGSAAFDEAFAYEGNDLGCTYSGERSVFKLWAPTASEALLLLYRSWTGEPDEVVSMERGERGVWSAAVERDLNGRFYTYRVRLGEQWNEAPDPYARAVGVNGDRSAILDLRDTDPEGWSKEKPPFSGEAVDAIIYEAHVRDLTIHPNSGVRQQGKFAGLSESGTRGPHEIPTGLDHIAALGVTHVQLLPVFDYSTESVDETRLDTPQYNWGYDPKTYNVPEGSYATDPYDPATRIRELKQLVQTLHSRGLRVVLDVVFNHVYDGYRASLAKLVPGYYLRRKPDGSLSDGSGCGNDTASERIMMRRFLVDSVAYWAEEYGIDGFRFDLMGLHDVKTMQTVRERLDQIDPTILVIGEGWDLETELPHEERAAQHNAARLPRIGQFNDSLRDAAKGSIFAPDGRGFVSGQPGLEEAVRTGVAGAIHYDDERQGFAEEPGQTVQFVECHDNHTLWDKLTLSAPDASEDELRSMHRLATAIVLTSQGTSFLHAGQEFLRTKNGCGNSYNQPDEVNRLDWERAYKYRDDVLYVIELIALRREHPAFRLRSAAEIRDHLRFEQAPDGCVAYTLRGHAGGDRAKLLYVLYHARRGGATELELPGIGSWSVRFGGEHVRGLEGTRLTAEGIGLIVLTAD